MTVSGGDPFVADIGIRGDTITAIGDLEGAGSADRIDATEPPDARIVRVASWGAATWRPAPTWQRWRRG